MKSQPQSPIGEDQVLALDLIKALHICDSAVSAAYLRGMLDDSIAPAPHLDDIEAMLEKLLLSGRVTKAEMLDGAATTWALVDPQANNGRATVCISEVELDSWWLEMDIDEKAEVFLLWTLGSTASVAEYVRIPVEGTIGSSSHEEAAQ